MNFEQVNLHLDAYKKNDQILDAAEYILRSFDLNNEYFEGFGFRNDEHPNSIVVTTEGNFNELQKIMIPRNLFNFDLNIVLNLLAHEMLHVRQKTLQPVVEDKNEREWQAYYEMLFHKNFPQIPDAPVFNRKQFAEKAFEYYKRMGEGSELQLKYATEKKEVEKLYEEILILRGEKKTEE